MTERSYKLNLFDLKNPDIEMFNSVDDELIKLSGSEMLYYKYYQDKSYSDVYMEDRSKTLSRVPILVHGHYDPKAIEERLTKFGLELESDQVFTFNKTYITKILGRAPIAGDVIEPKFQKIRFEIFEVQEDGFESYGIYHYICTAKFQRNSPDLVDRNLPNTSDPIGGRVDPL
jgi:hypothetical protein